MHEIDVMEAEYLLEHPDSGYLTEIIPLKKFPDYIDYLSHGCIVRKIGGMACVPEPDKALENPISLSRAEFTAFAAQTAALVKERFRENRIAAE